MSQGKIVQCIGAVVDIQFPRNAIPKVYDALELNKSEEHEGCEADLVFEVQQQLGDDVVRTIALGSSDGLRRGMKVKILEKTQEEQELLSNKIEEMKSRLNVKEVSEVNIYKWIELIKKHRDIKKLDKEILNELISKIYVHEKQVVDEETTQLIEILYNFIGNTKNLQVSYNL